MAIDFQRKENVLHVVRLTIKNKMKYIKTILPIFVLITTLFLSCEKENNDKEPSPKSKTVLIYMCAENTLGTNYMRDPVTQKNMTFYECDSAEIVRGATKLPENVNLIVFADKSSKNVKPFIAKVDKKGWHIVKSYDKDWYATDKEFMSEVINWTVKKFPATSYAMAFWGHGNGWMIMPESQTTITNAKAKRKAYGTDTGKDNNDGGDGYEKYINIPELAEVLSKAPHLDYIFFDCCQMMGAEVAYELRNVCDYIIGSPAEIPGFGAPYEYVVPDLFTDKEHAGQIIVDDYIKYNNFSDVGGQPLSVVKTSNMENLLMATNNCIDTIMAHYPYPQNLPLYDIIYYGMNSPSARQPIFYDLRNVMRKYLCESDFKAWDETFQKTVVYSVFPKDIKQTGMPDWNSVELTSNIYFRSFTMNKENYGGLSMFFPQTYYSNADSRYLNLNVSIKNLQWNTIIDWTRYNWE